MPILIQMEHVTERSNADNLAKVIIKAIKDKGGIEQGSLAQKFMSFGVGE